MAHKTCFVIWPIGDEGTETRDTADTVLEYIITAATEETGYAAPQRAETKWNSPE